MNDALLLRAARDADFAAIAAVINAAAEAYRGVIPADCWHEPYMGDDELAAEIAAGVCFSVLEQGGVIVAVMGSQDRGEVVLIRHAYVAPAAQRRGLGTRLLQHLRATTDRPVLIGTWAGAHWAIDFYRHHGFRVIAGAAKDTLLARFWTVPPRQATNSVVLAGTRYRA
ncbi:MAG: GNAT family N-acetyltransferase [Gammaproteobacteria bacterium]